MARVVVADDSLVMRALVSDALASGGHEVVGLSQGDDVLDLVRALQPDAVTLDLVMPGAGGRSILTQITKRHPDVRVVVCSASLTRDRELELLGLGAAELVSKPVGRLDLLEAFDRALAR
jgi:two-component system chemotaxis response regulator CheY